LKRNLYFVRYAVQHISEDIYYSAIKHRYVNGGGGS